MAGQDYKASGIRIFHFKDFCYLPLVTKTTSDPSYHYWTPLHSGMSNAVVSTGKQPWEGVDGFGHYYEIEGTSGQPLDVLKSDMSNNKWASTDQSITARKTSFTYDVAMKIVNSPSEASFIFQWSISGTDNTAYRLVLKNTGLYLEKQTSGALGVGWVQVANSFGGVFADTAFTPTPGTFYWFRIYYIPEDVVFRGETIYQAGSFIITTDSKRTQMGQGRLSYMEGKDSTTALTDGTLLGLGVNNGGAAGFDGIIFADGFIGQKGMPILMNKSLAGMLSSVLMFSLFNVDDRILPVEAGKRVELWINGWDEDGDALTVCDFDGSIKLISRKDGNNKCTVFAIEELWDLKRKLRDFTFDSSTYTTYKQWMIQEYWGEIGVPEIEPASRLTNLGFHADFGNNTISEDWSSTAYEGDMIQAFGLMSGHIMVWSPEGFLISTKYIPFSFTYNTEDSVKPQAIIGCRIDDDLIHYYNAVYVSGKSHIPSSSTDATEVADYGMKAKTKLFKTMPQSEADLIATNLLGQWHDSNPHIYLTILGLNPHIQPGCIVQVTIPSSGITELDMMVVQKKYHVGTWRGRGASGQEGAMTLVLSYCDPDAVAWRMPRLCTEDYEEVQHILEEVKADRKALF